METYKITEKEILIYGAGSTAKILAEQILKEKLNIVGFIDKRADLIKSFMDKKVYDLDALSCFLEKDNYVIIITTRNVFEHSSIANKLYDRGFFNVIFKPYSVLKGKGTNELKTLSNVHDSFLVKFTSYLDSIPKYTIKEMPIFEDKALISVEGDWAEAFIPAQLLFSNTLDGSIWSEANFISYYIAVKLYKAFERCAPDEFEEVVNEYIDNFAKPGAITHGINVEGTWGNILVDSRIQSYLEMNKLFALDNNFFIKNCTTVSVLKRDKLKLISSGKNRVSFMIAKGMNFIPVKLSIDDYEKYINRPKLDKILEFINKKQITEVFAPIPHPYFYEFNSIAQNYAHVCIGQVSNTLANLIFNKMQNFDFSKMTILDAMKDQGALGRHFSMLGAMVSRREFDGDELANYIDRLLNIDNISKDHSEAMYDVCLISDSLPKQVFVEILNKTKEYCFLYHETPYDKTESLLNDNGYSLDKKLFVSIWNNKKVEGRIYRRDR